MREIKELIVHCSDTDCGTEQGIRDFHINVRGWKDIGYHYVILNGKADSSHPDDDGAIIPGRPEEEIGAHCEGHNANSIGVCLVGVKAFTVSQMQALQSLLLNLMHTYNLTPENIHCHYEYDTAIAQGKTCPNIYIADVRALFTGEI
jgi:N-acetylmuramoyl-L-alanine amidase